MKTLLRLTNIRIISQVVFLGLFLFAVWASWTTRIQGYPVSRFLEIDLLVALSTALSTGHIYRFLGWSILLLLLTVLFGRVFCNWMCPLGTLHQFFGWLFNIRSVKERQEQNRYQPRQIIKYSILFILLIIAAFGTVQIGLLDPIALLHRSVATGISVIWDFVMSNTSFTQSAVSSRNHRTPFHRLILDRFSFCLHYRFEHLASPFFLSNTLSAWRSFGFIVGISTFSNSPRYKFMHGLRPLFDPL